MRTCLALSSAPSPYIRVFALQVEKAALPNSKSGTEPVRTSGRTRSSRRKVNAEVDESAKEELQENGDVSENQVCE